VVWPLLLRVAMYSLAPAHLPRFLGVLARTAERPACALLEGPAAPAAPFVTLGATAWLTAPALDFDWPPAHGYALSAWFYFEVCGGRFWSVGHGAWDP
jgi:hypothetical protein